MTANEWLLFYRVGAEPSKNLKKKKREKQKKKEKINLGKEIRKGGKKKTKI